jgi:hypothetical protein
MIASIGQPHHVVRRKLAGTADRSRDGGTNVHLLACGRHIMALTDDLDGFLRHPRALIAIEMRHVVSAPNCVQFMPVDTLPRLAFNHNEIIRRGVERIRGKASYSSLPALLMPSALPSRSCN